MTTEANTVLSDEQDLFKNVCRLHTEWTIDRYLMSNAVNRLDPAEKAERHIDLCKFYVAAVRGCSVEDAMHDYMDDFEQLHDESQELTSSLDMEIGFPLDQTPDYAALNPKFFERFHEIACRVLGVPALCATVKALRAERLEIQRALASSVLHDPTEDDNPPYSTTEVVNGILGLISRKESLLTRCVSLKAWLSEVERERDAEKKDHQLTIDTFRRQEQIWQQKHDDFIKEAIELCKAKAVDAEDKLGMVLGNTAFENGRKKASEELATELETLK